MPLFTLMGQATWSGGTTKKVGWFEEWGLSRRHDPADLERRLAAQRDTGFNRKSFDRLLKAQDALIAKAAKAKPGSPRHEALVEAYNAAEEIASEAENQLHTPANFDAITKSFENAARIKHSAAIYEAAQAGRALYQEQQETYRRQQEEEAERKAIEADDADITAAFEAHTQKEIEELESQIKLFEPLIKNFARHAELLKDYGKAKKKVDNSAKDIAELIDLWTKNKL